MLMREWCHLCDQIRCKEDITTLAKSYPQWSYDTLRALFEQSSQRQLSRKFYLIKQHGNDFKNSYENGETLPEIAENFDLTPVMVARRVLELVLGADRRTVTRLLREPDLISESRLREEVRYCVHIDDVCGPNCDRSRAVIGLEYEHRLLDHVRNLHLEFETENELRLRNSYKTPDVLLRVPVAFCQRVVCWIDSKAKFADEYSLNRDYTDSVSSYIGRFGPGMVIYWFGFIEDCPCPMLNDDGVFVVDHFPTSIQLLPGSQLPPRSSDATLNVIDLDISLKPVIPDAKAGTE